MSGVRFIYPRRWIVRRTASIHDDIDLFGKASPTYSNNGVEQKTPSPARVSNPKPKLSNSFRVVSYNILTDNCIRDGQYLYCPAGSRYMSTRFGRILDEIRSMDPDVACLQEVDEDNFRNRLKPEMEKMGYEGVNCPRSDDQGLATFWRSSTFQMVKHKTFLLSEVFAEYLEINCISDSLKNSIKDWFQRPEVTTIVQLNHLATGRSIAVCNNHVAWAGLRCPVLQVLQISIAFRQLVDFVGSVSCSLVFCGDFNSPPSFPGYHLLSRGYLSRKDFEKFIHDNIQLDEVDKEKYFIINEVIPDIFRLPFKLESAYASVMGDEPSVTNCDGAHDDGLVRPLCLDYIWFGMLEVTSVLETPSLSVLTEHVALPSTCFPSDHLPIAAQFLVD